jgi:broad specificity phosphatase PhoE
MSHPNLPEIYLARHGETEWSLSGQHTGLSDIPLTPRGEQIATRLVPRLAGIEFAQVLTSPLQRASRTCALAGFEGRAKVDPDLVEWDYGALEGLKTAEIHRDHPGWTVFRDGCPGGESVAQIGERADRVIARLRQNSGRTILFSHGHFGRVLATRWLGLPVGDARLFLLGTAAISILGYEHNLDEPVLRLWNDDRHAKD